MTLITSLKNEKVDVVKLKHALERMRLEKPKWEQQFEEERQQQQLAEEFRRLKEQENIQNQILKAEEQK
jgi:hypothetical protein